jgi:pimeloyl-ACP methyl ester carboxylesterase
VTGILLVHGAWNGPWSWDQFAAHLVERGHDVRAAQLRGHDQAPGRIWHRVHHYVEDVRRAAAEFPEPPVVVGHSMGGLVVQRYLEQNPARSAVLMATVPIRGTLPAVARLAARYPIPTLRVNLLWSLRPFIATRALVRGLHFTAETPSEVVERFGARLQDESYFAFIDTMFVRARPPRVRVPVLVLGAELDGVFTPAEMHRTARAYGAAEAEIFSGIGHAMMLDQGWRRVADRVAAWAESS